MYSAEAGCSFEGKNGVVVIACVCTMSYNEFMFTKRLEKAGLIKNRGDF